MGWLLFWACFYCWNRVEPRAATMGAAVQFHCEIDVDLMSPEGCGGLEASQAPSSRRPQPAPSESHNWASLVHVDLGLCR